jgi:hypothetical protein
VLDDDVSDRDARSAGLQARHEWDHIATAMQDIAVAHLRSGATVDLTRAAAEVSA